MYPNIEVMKNFAKDVNDYEDCGDLQISKQDISLSEKLVHENDSLYEMHDQVPPLYSKRTIFVYG